MYLKRLELSGFKSFATRTELEFGPGLTAIVGPNGSGKSNIADAIRWVLGEQNPRLLRGSRVEDLIFSGSEGRRAVGLAEVLLVLDNEDGTLPTDYREVVIGRRVDRAGGSDYLLNRTPCRLRDIQELFYDTGVGREAYSLVGQGRIDEILTARAEERRSLLEEAAGIVRFKVRKQEAVRRLGHVEERLVRLADILGELDARIGPLAVEAERARRHRALEAELSSLELGLRLGELRRSERRVERSRREVDGCRREAERLREEMQGLEARAADRREALTAAEAELEKARAELERQNAEHERLAARRQVVRERRQNLSARLAELESEEQALTRELGDRAAADRGDRARLGETRARCDELRRRRDELGEHLNAAEAEVRNAEAELAAARDGVFAAMGDAAAARNESTRCETELRAARTRQGRLSEQLAAHEQELARLRDRIAALQREADAKRAHQQREEERLERLTEERRRLLARQGRIEPRLQELQEQVADARSRVQTLEALHKSYEGFYGGVRTVLRGRDRSDPAFAEVIGVVAELFSTSDEYRLAIEAALGGALQYVVVRTGDGAQRAIERLRETRGGRVTFLPLDGLRPPGRTGDDGRVLRLEGVLGWATEFVSFPEEIRAAAGYLLGRVLITRELASARQAARTAGYALRAVTLEGDVVHVGGAISGGSADLRRRGLLNRRQDLQATRERLQRLEAGRAAVGEAAERLRVRLRALAAERENALESAGQARQAAAARAQELAALREADERLQHEIEALTDEQAVLAAHVSELSSQGQAARERAAEHARRAEAARKRLDTLSENLPALQRQASILREQAAEIAASLAAAVEQVTALENWERRSRRELQALEERLAGVRGEARLIADQVSAIDGEIESVAAEQERVATEREHLRTRVGQISASRRELAEQMAEAEQALVKLRASVEQQQQILHRAEIEHARAELEVDQLRRLLRETFGDVGVEAATEAGGIAGTDEGELRRRAGAVKRQLAEIGAVNPHAEDEYRALRERYRFLRGQADDLIQARDRLQRLLTQMDDKMDEHFSATFSQLRVAFQGVFRRLFGGGHADLVIAGSEREDAPPGVEILAQPPGKRLQPLSLLSGGERALTAIALLFALLEVKPAPFCVIDEIDAALDEVNLERFASYLRELSQTMQFLVITHQKATMAVADALYGVTLSDEGSSRLVAVRLQDVVAAPAS